MLRQVFDRARDECNRRPIGAEHDALEAHKTRVGNTGCRGNGVLGRLIKKTRFARLAGTNVKIRRENRVEPIDHRGAKRIHHHPHRHDQAEANEQRRHTHGHVAISVAQMRHREMATEAVRLRQPREKLSRDAR